MIRGGRKYVRNVLYMCAVTSIGHAHPMGLTYRNLVRRDKCSKVALTAPANTAGIGKNNHENHP